VNLLPELKIAFDLLQHAALILLAAIGYGLARQSLQARLSPPFEQSLYGIVFGLLGALSALTGVELASGVVSVDLHIAVVIVATLFAGRGAGLMTAAIVIVARGYVIDALPVNYVPNTLLAVALSAVVATHRRRRGAKIGWRDLTGLGFLLAVTGLGFAAWLPHPLIPLSVIAADWAPWIVLNVLTVLLLGGVVMEFERGRALTLALRDGEQRFRSFYNETPIMLTATDEGGRIVAVSDAWLEATGYRRDEVIGHDRWEFIAPPFAAYFRDRVLPELERTRRIEDVEYQLIRKDGRPLDARVTAIWGRDPVSGAGRILSFAVDQTARRQAERALEEKERDLTAIMDNAPLAISLKDRSGRFRLINRCYAEWFGVRPEDVCGRTSAELYSPTLAERIENQDRQVLEHGQVAEWERPVWKGNTKPGIEYVLETKIPIRDDSGDVVGLAGFVSDITSRKRDEIALRESRELLIESQRLGKLGYILADIANKRVYWSDSLFELRGVARREFFAPGESLLLLHPEDQRKYAAARDAAVAAHRDFAIDVRTRRTDGSYGWEHIVGHPRVDERGKLTSILQVLLDITEAKRVEEIIRSNEERFRALIENSNDIIVVVQTDGIISFRGPSIGEGLGYSNADVIGRKLIDLIHPDDAVSIEDVLRTIGAKPGLHATGRSRLRHRDGSWRHIAWSARNATHIAGVNGIVVNCHDVTKARNLEERLHQAQKMEAVGQLAGGIAHDFNNIVGAMLGFAGFLLQDLPKDSPQHGFAARIILAGERARDLIQQILAFSRHDVVERRPCDLGAIVHDTRDLLVASLPSSTRIAIADGEPLVVEVNAAQIGQILINLCLNANDALAGKPGCISIALSRVVPGDADYALFRRGEGESAGDVDAVAGRICAGTLDAAQPYARIAIADSGVGMGPEVLARVFDPFFTTKEPGRGTGLGLSVVHGIVIGYRGACTVSSRVGAGTTFAVYLPLAGEGTRAAVALPPPTIVHGHERILVVDDDVDMTDMLTIGLDRLGYEVVALNDPAEALAVFAADPSAWDVVISDQVMPGMKGLALHERLKAIRPRLRFVLCTGFSDGATEAMALTAGVDAFFLKPVSAEQLAARIRRLMDETPQAAEPV
jgi:PAS domain S-box-containing protein